MKINILDPNLSQSDTFNLKFYECLKRSKNFNSFKIFGNLNIENSLKKKFNIQPIFNVKINPRVDKDYTKSYYYLKNKFIETLNNNQNLSGSILLYNTTLCYIEALIEWIIINNYNYNVYLEIPTLLGSTQKNKFFLFEKKRCDYIKKLIKNKKNIFFISHFQTSSERLKTLFKPKIKNLNFPINLQDYKLQQKKIKKNRKLTIGFLGEQRFNKGLKLIPKIISNLISYKNLKITVHDPSKNFNNFFKKKYSDVKFEMKKFDNKNFINFLNKFDIIIFPYNPHRYKFSYSSTLIDAILFEKIIVVPNNTILSKTISSKNRKKFSFQNWNASSISSKTLKLINKFSENKIIIKKERINLINKIYKKNYSFDSLKF